MTSDERLPTIAASLDALCIVIFVTIGRRNHDEGTAMSGILQTAAPFAIALFIAWAVVRAWRQPTSVRTGLMIWPIVILVGMLLRRFVFDDGTATVVHRRRHGLPRPVPRRLASRLDPRRVSPPPAGSRRLSGTPRRRIRAASRRVRSATCHRLPPERALPRST